MLSVHAHAEKINFIKIEIFQNHWLYVLQHHPSNLSQMLIKFKNLIIYEKNKNDISTGKFFKEIST